MLLVALITISTSANADDPIVIQGSGGKAISIAVVPFGYADANGVDIASIIANDLYYSGIFEPLPSQNILSMPHQPKDVAFRDWSAVNAQYLLIGNATQTNGRVQLQYYLFNVMTQKQIYAGTAAGSANQIRALAHYIADQVYLQITGNKGAFSTKLLFVNSVNNQQYSLLLSDYDGMNMVTLLNSKEPILSPRFSPDGKKVAYVSFESRRPRIFIQDIATGQREQVTNFEGLNGAPAWSPDGSKLALVLSKDGNPELYMLDVATKALSRLTNNDAIDTEPVWGKDGKTIYFTSDRGGSPQIYKINTATGTTERVTTVGNYNANTKVSADEKMLVMVHRQDGYRNFVIATLELANGRVRILSNTNLDESPTIAPNGTMVIYATRKGGKGSLMLASVNGRVRVQLPIDQGDIREPSWSPFIK